MKITLRLLAATAIISAATIAAPASATTLLFNYVSAISPLANFSFQVNQTPTVTPGSNMFEIANVSTKEMTIFGSQTTTSAYSFFSSVGGGGFNDYYGAQLYTGSTAAPTFLIGTFSMFADSTKIFKTGTLTIANAAVAAVPEPATWAMMLVGFGMVGAAMRYRSRKTNVVYA